MLTDSMKKQHLANLIKLAKADGQVDLIEDFFIKGIALKLGIGSDEFKRIVDNHETLIGSAPMDKSQQVDFYGHYLHIVSSDRALGENEISLCKELGKRLQLPQDKVDGVLQEIQDAPQNVVDVEALKAKLQ